MQRHLAIHIDWLVSCFSNSSSIPRPRYMCIYIFFFFFKFASLFPQRITILMVSIVAMLQRSLKNIASFIYDFPRMTKPTVTVSLFVFVQSSTLRFSSVLFVDDGVERKVTDFGLRRKIKRASVVPSNLVILAPVLAGNYSSMEVIFALLEFARIGRMSVRFGYFVQFVRWVPCKWLTLFVCKIDILRQRLIQFFS